MMPAPVKRSRRFCLLLRCALLAATLNRSEEHADPETEDSQVEDHLHGDDEAGHLSGRGDVSEADRGEDGDREVQRIGPGERMHVEVIEISLSHQKVGGREQKQEQWRGGCERFDSPNRRVPSFDDRSYLVDRHGGQHEQSSREGHPQRDTGQVVERQQEYAATRTTVVAEARSSPMTMSRRRVAAGQPCRGEVVVTS